MSVTLYENINLESVLFIFDPSETRFIRRDLDSFYTVKPNEKESSDVVVEFRVGSLTMFHNESKYYLRFYLSNRTYREFHKSTNDTNIPNDLMIKYIEVLSIIHFIDDSPDLLGKNQIFMYNGMKLVLQSNSILASKLSTVIYWYLLPICLCMFVLIMYF
jgi:hypothetical protein